MITLYVLQGAENIGLTSIQAYVSYIKKVGASEWLILPEETYQDYKSYCKTKPYVIALKYKEWCKLMKQQGLLNNGLIKI